MDVREIDGISLGKSGLLLKAPGGGGVSSSQCFSLSCGSKTLAAATSAPEGSQILFNAISHILSCSKDRLSQDKKLASDGSVKNPVVGFYVVRWTPELEAMEKKRKELAKGPPKVNHKDLMDCKEVKQLKKGLNIMVYSLDELNIAKASKMCLLYDTKNASRLGTLIWCDRRKKRKPPKDSGRLEVDSLTCISLKKQTRILQTSAATMAEAEACLSLIGPDSQVSIEMEEGELEVEIVLKALQHIISVSKDKKMIRKAEGHGKFEKVTDDLYSTVYPNNMCSFRCHMRCLNSRIFWLQKLGTEMKMMKAQMHVSNFYTKVQPKYHQVPNPAHVNVDMNWTSPLGFDGGVVAGGG